MSTICITNSTLVTEFYCSQVFFSYFSYKYIIPTSYFLLSLLFPFGEFNTPMLYSKVGYNGPDKNLNRAYNR